jgi:hypothetical protein
MTMTTCQLCKRELAPDETVYRCRVSGSYWKLPTTIPSLCEECRNKVLRWDSYAYSAKYGYARGYEEKKFEPGDTAVFAYDNARGKHHDEQVKAWWASLSVETRRAETFAFVLREFRSAEPCDNCQRPIMLQMEIKKPPKHLVCGDECRAKVYSKVLSMHRHKTPMPTFCQGCKERFLPKRQDARWCSSACRQRAYRVRARGDMPVKRQREEEAMPVDEMAFLREKAPELAALVDEGRFKLSEMYAAAKCRA